MVDADDRPVPRGDPGELICRPRHPHMMMEGYLNKPEVTLKAYRNLWFHTGDILREDEDGYFYFLDRAKDRIRRRGENISSAEVELVIISHPAIDQCAVVPYSGENNEDEIRAFVVLRPGDAGTTAAGLHEWLVSRLPKTMLPRYIEIVAEIQRTATGKPEKQRLQSLALGPSSWDAKASLG